jgi:hypothetical protein
MARSLSLNTERNTRKHEMQDRTLMLKHPHSEKGVNAPILALDEEIAEVMGIEVADIHVAVAEYGWCGTISPITNAPVIALPRSGPNEGPSDAESFLNQKEWIANHS